MSEQLEKFESGKPILISSDLLRPATDEELVAHAIDLMDNHGWTEKAAVDRMLLMKACIEADKAMPYKGRSDDRCDGCGVCLCCDECECERDKSSTK